MLCQEVVQVGCLVPGSDCLRKYIPRYKSLSDHLIHPSEILMAVILFKGNRSVNPVDEKNWHGHIAKLMVLNKMCTTTHYNHTEQMKIIEIFSTKVDRNSCLQVGYSTPVYFNLIIWLQIPPCFLDHSRPTNFSEIILSIFPYSKEFRGTNISDIYTSFK